MRPGDTLYAIGWRHNQDYRDIAAWNDIPPPYILKRGQRLRVAPRVAVVSTNTPPTNSLSAPRTPLKTVPQTAPFAAPKNEENAPSPFSDSENGIVWRWPAQGSLVRVFSGVYPTNKGIDIDGILGQPVYAAASGRIVYSGSGLIGYGKLIIVKHNDIFLSAYAHNNEVLVNEGDAVSAGQQIARMGRTGTERAMLHFEIRRNGKPINPIEYLPRRHLQQLEDSG
ncbi:MAG: peptidoglycan DD-metalloendopeptidase family protein [Pseudomonadota bacterium]